MQAFPTGSDIRDTTSADITGDGKPDLIVANYASYAGSVSVVLNTSAPGVLTKVSLKVVTLANEGGAFGFAAEKVKSYSRAGLAKPLKNLDAANGNNDASLGEDFVLRTV